MKLHERHQFILKKLKISGKMPPAELSSLLNISKETLRKDLIFLEEIGVVSRSYGLVELNENNETMEILKKNGLLSSDERRNQILKMIQTKKKIRLTTLARTFQISPGTLRNDLQYLEKKGSIQKKHGEVIWREEENTDITDNFPDFVAPLAERAILHINPHETIFLDRILFSQYIALHLPMNYSVNVVTNSIEIINILISRNYQHEVFMLPGELLNESKSLRMLYTDSFFANIHIHKAFINFYSYANNEFYLGSETGQANLQIIADNSDYLFGFLDSSKLKTIGSFRFPMEKYHKKIHEIMIDDKISRDEADSLLPGDFPISLCGRKYTLLNIKNKEYKVGLSVMPRHNYFLQQVISGIEDNASQHKNITLLRSAASTDFDSLSRYLDFLIKEKVDLLIDFSLDFEHSVYISERLNEEGLKVLSVDNPIPGAIYYGAMNSQAGTIAGNHAAQLIHQNWDGSLDHIIVLAHDYKDSRIDLRITSTITTLNQKLNEHPRVSTIYWKKNEQESVRALENILSSTTGSERCLFIPSDLKILLESYDTIEKMRSQENTIIISQNYSPLLEENAIHENSPLLGYVSYHPENYGKHIIDLTLKILNNEDINQMNYTEHEWIPNEKHPWYSQA